MLNTRLEVVFAPAWGHGGWPGVWPVVESDTTTEDLWGPACAGPVPTCAFRQWGDVREDVREEQQRWWVNGGGTVRLCMSCYMYDVTSSGNAIDIPDQP